MTAPQGRLVVADPDSLPDVLDKCYADRFWLRSGTNTTFFKVVVLIPPGYLTNSSTLPFPLTSTNDPSKISTGCARVYGIYLPL